MSPAALRRWRRNIGGAVASEHPRPATRADCRTGPRPCPYVGCRHHLYIEVKPSGAITVNWPHLEPWEIPESCALDVAECGQHTLDEIGALLNLSWERVRKIEGQGLAQLREEHGDELARLRHGDQIHQPTTDVDEKPPEVIETQDQGPAANVGDC